ncbi:MAG: hypothetical protein ABSC76_20335 [Terracidiphilus sp.]|jgi:hypothetical protein
MEQETLPEKREEGKPTRSFGNSKALFFSILFLYAIVDWEFLFRLWTLIGSQLHFYDYLFNAIAFEACLVASAVELWRCLRVLQAAEEVTLNTKDIVRQITILVVMLLLSLMQLSSFTQAYDKIKPR